VHKDGNAMKYAPDKGRIDPLIAKSVKEERGHDPYHRNDERKTIHQSRTPQR